MGVQRALRCAAAVIAAASARAPALGFSVDATAVEHGDEKPRGADHKTGAETPKSPPRSGGRARTATAKAVEFRKSTETKSVVKGVDAASPGGSPLLTRGAGAVSAEGDATESADETSKKTTVEAQKTAAEADASLAKEKDAFARGAALRASAALPNGVWSDPVAVASLDPALAAALRAVERCVPRVSQIRHTLFYL
jgi:hypothetical protein